MAKINWEYVVQDLEARLQQAHSLLAQGGAGDIRALQSLEHSAGLLPAAVSWENEVNTQHKARAESLVAVARKCAGWVGAGTNRGLPQRMIETALAGDLDDPSAGRPAASRPPSPTPRASSAGTLAGAAESREKAEATAIATAGGPGPAPSPGRWNPDLSG